MTENELSSRALAKIRALSGMDEVKAFADKLVMTAENAKMAGIKYPPLPNLILSADPGTGVTTIIRLLTDLIQDLRLMQFHGETEFFETRISDIRTDFSLLLRRISDAAGFYSDFQGVIGVDLVSGFNTGKDFKELERLMDFMDIHQGKILFIFIIPLDPKPRQLSEFLHLFTNRTPAELLRLPFPPISDNIEFVRQRLADHRLGLTEEGESSLTEVLRELREDPNFKGYQTLENLADELMWTNLSSPNGGSRVIGGQEIQKLLETTHMLGIVRARIKKNQDKHIGFL